jgi:hypothetical protein
LSKSGGQIHGRPSSPNSGGRAPPPWICHWLSNRHKPIDARVMSVKTASTQRFIQTGQRKVPNGWEFLQNMPKDALSCSTPQNYWVFKNHQGSAKNSANNVFEQTFHETASSPEHCWLQCRGYRWLTYKFTNHVNVSHQGRIFIFTFCFILELVVLVNVAKTKPVANRTNKRMRPSDRQNNLHCNVRCLFVGSDTIQNSRQGNQ